MKHPVSALALGEYGWIQTLNFILSGVLLLAFDIGMYRILKRVKEAHRGMFLLACVGIGIIGSGIFTTDPVYGYPTELPLRTEQFTLTGILHHYLTLMLFVCQPLTCFTFGRMFLVKKKLLWGMYSSATGFMMLLTFVMAGMGFIQHSGLVEIAGLCQRLSILSGGLWITLLAIQLYIDPAFLRKR
jgi:hypothetical protein